MADHEKELRSLAMNDEACISSLLGLRLEVNEVATLPPKTRALVRLSALVCADASPASYQWAVDVALAAGANDDEVMGTLVAVAPIIGFARVVAAAPEIAIALGYPLEAALELIRDPESS